ncbi:unnamed protein product [Angiostrongylus costaricensis]|uniref:BRCA1-associated protein n=1 Tax=Angiostrongylus costaricensis TaxID=334426 RepID=A0A0R3PAV2_ANGCS|nr:unnamed protein product [Angiostrongylus costaricensis]
MSYYRPLILRLEVRNGAPQISFCESSKLDIGRPCFIVVTVCRGFKHEMQPPTNFRGRRTYSEVVVESLEADKCSSTSTSKISSLDPDHVTYYYGNPFVEKTEGILHFFKYNDERMGREVQCRMLCMIAVPSQITLREILLFIGKFTILSLKIIRDSTPNEYMIILKFKTHNDAVVFYDEFNGNRFNSLEQNRCRLLFVDRIECKGSSSSFTEIPTCAVCLERMDDSVVSILCNHAFHAACLEQWTDTTCPVCRYIQTPEVVAEQRCSVCGQSSDLWICLICGNIGCGRYAEGHAFRHFELTSHTFCLQVGGQRVWDYAGDNYVHRLIQSDTEGKVVEYQRAESEEKKDKLDGIKLEYTCLLTSQLESQRMYFEARLADMQRAMNNMEKMAQAQVTSELKDEREMNEMLRKDQQLWKNKVLDSTEYKTCCCKFTYSLKISELQEQISDLMLHFEAQSKLQCQLDSAQLSKEEIESSQVGVSVCTPERKLRRKNKR